MVKHFYTSWLIICFYDSINNKYRSFFNSVQISSFGYVRHEYRIINDNFMFYIEIFRLKFALYGYTIIIRKHTIEYKLFSKIKMYDFKS